MVFRNLAMLLVALCFVIEPVIGQVKMTDEVKATLEKMQLDYLQPVESFYRSLPIKKNIFLDYQMAVTAPDVNLEIRYAFRPIGSHSFDSYPNVHSMSAVSSVATNNQDEEMILRVLEDDVAAEAYNADWAAIVDFVPKFQFSELPNGRMLALYAEGKGSVFIFFLYDEPSKFLEDQIANIKFKE
ncbi:MAG: hypothetical protein AAF502_24420 [Bacteroidota bacterium]